MLSKMSDSTIPTVVKIAMVEQKTIRPRMIRSTPWRARNSAETRLRAKATSATESRPTTTTSAMLADALRALRVSAAASFHSSGVPKIWPRAIEVISASTSASAPLSRPAVAAVGSPAMTDRSINGPCAMSQKRISTIPGKPTRSAA